MPQPDHNYSNVQNEDFQKFGQNLNRTIEAHSRSNNTYYKNHLIWFAVIAAVATVINIKMTIEITEEISSPPIEEPKPIVKVVTPNTGLKGTYNPFILGQALGNGWAVQYRLEVTTLRKYFPFIEFRDDLTRLKSQKPNIHFKKITTSTGVFSWNPGQSRIIKWWVYVDDKSAEPTKRVLNSGEIKSNVSAIVISNLLKQDTTQYAITFWYMEEGDNDWKKATLGEA